MFPLSKKSSGTFLPAVATSNAALLFVKVLGELAQLAVIATATDILTMILDVLTTLFHRREAADATMTNVSLILPELCLRLINTRSTLPSLRIRVVFAKSLPTKAS